MLIFFIKRHGSGVLTLVNGTVYDGQWDSDFMNGQGKMIYPNGDEYSGTWHKNRVCILILCVRE